MSKDSKAEWFDRFYFVWEIQVLAGHTIEGTNGYSRTLLGTRSFATKHSFSTDKGLC